MSTFFTVLVFPLKLLIDEEPNSFMRGVYLIVCIVWYLIVFCIGHAIWQFLPVVWALIVLVVKAESARPGQFQAQSDKLMDWMRDYVGTSVSSVQHDQAQAKQEIAHLTEVVSGLEARLSKLEPIPIETVQSMDVVMEQFVKGSDA